MKFKDDDKKIIIFISNVLTSIGEVFIGFGCSAS